ncbi:hypothetical protein VNI00_014738 [Paramarasmius palmivorus]|uniref:Uncharacterized protein n=1 Tax=Paramarasmius palmivorus TaxID=297713 RepID=A0AAW0BQQ5_9AGAR
MAEMVAEQQVVLSSNSILFVRTTCLCSVQMMLSHLDVALLSAINMVYNGLFNTRRLESPCYAIWSVVLAKLIDKDEDILIHCPQYAMYLSKADSQLPSGSSPDISFLTAPDSEAIGVIVDHALLLPSTTLKRPGTILEFLKNLSPAQIDSSFRELSLADLFVPLLVEVKRPVTRHPGSITSFVRGLWELMSAAQLQAEEQAFCLFSSVRHATQNTAIIIAAAGHYWSWKRCTRDGYRNRTAFNINVYQTKLVTAFSSKADVEEDGLASAGAELDDLLPPRDVDNAKRLREQLFKAITSRDNHTVVLAREAQTAERNKRASKRSVSRDTRQEAEDALAEFTPAKTSVHAYEIQDLNECFRLLILAEKIEVDRAPEMFIVPDDQTTMPPHSNDEDLDWSPIMRLGTRVSDSNMALIREHLDKFVLAERQNLQNGR